MAFQSFYSPLGQLVPNFIIQYCPGVHVTGGLASSDVSVLLQKCHVISLFECGPRKLLGLDHSFPPIKNGVSVSWYLYPYSHLMPVMLAGQPFCVFAIGKVYKPLGHCAAIAGDGYDNNAVNFITNRKITAKMDILSMSARSYLPAMIHNNKDTHTIIVDFRP